MMVFEDVFGHRLHLDSAHQAHLLAEHPEIRPYVDRLETVFSQPEWVKRSQYNFHVYLYYRFYPDVLGGKYLLGVANISPPATVLTAYVTDTIKQGALVWPKR